MSAARVPLVDLGAQHRQIESELNEGFARVIGQTAFVLGEDVAAFEAEFARFVDVRHCVGVASGTDALELALRAVGVGRGDDVIVPANTFIATALAVVRAGATPVLVDVDPETLLIDPVHVAAKTTARTKAVIPVHLYGQMAPMEALAAYAADARVHLIEDAAQAQGARRGGRAAGSVGIVAATSFYPGKNLGAYGDAGAVMTNVDELASRLRALRNYGSEQKYHHPELGFNSRLDTLQAVVLRAKLRRLAAWNEARREAAKRYDAWLSGMAGIARPSTSSDSEHVYHLYVIRVAHRDRVLAALQAAGIGAGVHYPVPIHLQGAFAHLGHQKGAFPHTERAAEEILSLPMFPEISPEQQLRAVDVLREVVRV